MPEKMRPTDRPPKGISIGRLSDVRRVLGRTLVRSPIGWIAVAAGRAGVAGLEIQPRQREAEEYLRHRFPWAEDPDLPLLQQACRELEEYFRGDRQVFTLPLIIPEQSAFTATVLEHLMAIPCGRTVTYGELAARAVGRVMAGNGLPLLLPCHRVVGAGGKLTGYSGGEGLTTKEWLIKFEKEKCSSGGEKNLTPPAAI